MTLIAAGAVLGVSLTDLVHGTGTTWQLAIPASAGRAWQPVSWLLLARGVGAVAVPILLVFVGQLLEAQLGHTETALLLLTVGTCSAGVTALALPGRGVLDGAAVLVPGLLGCAAAEHLVHRAAQRLPVLLLLALSTVPARFDQAVWVPSLAAASAGAVAGIGWHVLSERGHRSLALGCWMALAGAGYLAWAVAA